jgi:hypothetical protein
MTHEILLNEVRSEFRIGGRSNNTTDLHTRSLIMGKLGYLQGVLGYRADIAKGQAEKGRYALFLNEVDNMVKEVARWP